MDIVDIAAESSKVVATNFTPIRLHEGLSCSTAWPEPGVVCLPLFNHSPTPFVLQLGILRSKRLSFPRLYNVPPSSPPHWSYGREHRDPESKWPCPSSHSKTSNQVFRPHMLFSCPQTARECGSQSTVRGPAASKSSWSLLKHIFPGPILDLLNSNL